MLKYLPLLMIALAPLQVLDDYQENPDYHTRVANLFLDRVVPKEYWYKTRFISFHGTPRKAREDRLKTWNFWVNNLHFKSAPEFVQEVPKSNGLYWFYLEDFAWNAAAWKAVSERTPYFAEGVDVFPDAAQGLRDRMGLKQNTTTFQIEGIIRADWLFRDSVESDRSATYFDLLFAKERFGGQRDEVIYHPGGDYTWPDGSISRNVAPGQYTVKKGENKDFPKNEAEWTKAFGINDVAKFLKDNKINAKHGAIVDKDKSVVARNNRILEALRTPFGSFWKTFDVNVTAGRRDFAETLIFDFDFDAGELISNLPGGGQAYLLTLKNGTIVNVADNKVAIDRSDSRDVRVRTPGSCVICHESGIINPQNLVVDLLKKGIDVKFKDKQKANDVRGFFLDWEEELLADQKRYVKLISRTSGWEPGINATKFKEWRDAYDAAVDSNQAALECGVPTDIFKVVMAKSPRVRLNQLVQGDPIPRDTWEATEYKNAMLLLSLARAYQPKLVEVKWLTK